MQIENHRIVGIPFRQAAGCGGKLVPTGILAHDTAGGLSKGNVVNYFASPGCKVSAHVVVERDGSATQMVDFNVRAWHADPSIWGGKAGCNWRFVGIEILNPGKLQRQGQECVLIYPGNRIVSRFPVKDCVSVDSAEHGGPGWWLPYTPEQIKTVKEICRALVETYGIEIILGHFHVAPRRKIDPSPLFPFDAVRTYAFKGEEQPEEEPPPVMPDNTAIASSADINPGDLVSRTIRDANVLKILGTATAGGAAAKGVHDANVPATPVPPAPPVPDVSLESVGDQIGVLQKVMDGVGTLSEFVVKHYWIAGIIIGLALWWYGRRIIAWYIDDIRSGKREPIFKITKRLVG